MTLNLSIGNILLTSDRKSLCIAGRRSKYRDAVVCDIIEGFKEKGFNVYVVCTKTSSLPELVKDVNLCKTADWRWFSALSTMADERPSVVIFDRCDRDMTEWYERFIEEVQPKLGNVYLVYVTGKSRPGFNIQGWDLLSTFHKANDTKRLFGMDIDVNAETSLYRNRSGRIQVLSNRGKQ